MVIVSLFSKTWYIYESMERSYVEQNTLERSGRTKEKLVRLLACGVFAVGAIGCEQEEQAPTLPEYSYDSNTPSGALPVDIPGPLTEMTAVIVGDPNREVAPRFGDERSVREVFRDADRALSETTDNEISLPNNLAIEHLEVAPSKKMGREWCYDGEELGKIDAKVPGDGVLVLLDETPGCMEFPAKGDTTRAVAWVYGGTKTAVFGYKSELTLGTANHELGHVLGLPHHTEIRQTQKGGLPYVYTKQEIGERLNHPDFGVARRPDGSVDEYAATTSAMGNSGNVKSTEIYHPLELAKIVDDVHVPLIGAEPAEYSISIRGKGNRGLKLSLPSGHPLRKIDADMEAVSISTMSYASSGGGEVDQLRVAITAESPHMLYDIYALPRPYLCLQEELCGKNSKEWATVYKDKALGVEIQVIWGGKDDLKVRTLEYS